MISLLAHQSTPQSNVRVVLLFAGLWVGWVGADRILGTGFQRLPLWGGFSILAAGAALLVAAIIVPQLADNAGISRALRLRSTASLTIVEPTPGEVISDDTFRMAVDLSGGTVVDTTSTRVRPDTGHIHVSLDGRLLSMSSGTEEEFDASVLAPGPHILEVEFVAADHAPFDPRVIERVTFEKGA